MPNVRPECGIESRRIIRLQCADFTNGVGMAANGALPEDHQRARENICALHGDADGRCSVAGRNQVARPARNCSAAQNVHGIADGLARELGAVVLHDGGHHRRLGAAIQPAAGVAARGLQHVGPSAKARQRLHNSAKHADGHAKLLPHGSVCTSHARCGLYAAGASRGQRDATPGCQALH